MATQDIIEPRLRISSAALNKSSAHFARPSGRNLLNRTEPFLRWHDVRTESQVWPYSRCMTSPPHAIATVQDESGLQTEGLNFASQDYLSLSTHPAIITAAMRALQEFGTHSASSPMLQGNTTLSLQLEDALSTLLKMEHIALFSTG